MLVLLAVSAFAVRPTEGGLYSFDDSDTVESWDEPSGLVRVHYSVAGTNETDLDDDDADGVPDFAEEVAVTAAAAIELYTQTWGFLAPVSEADMGLGELGGSGAFDFYLVDFGGDADGYFGTDRCDDERCSGFMVMENDFRGYGYPNLHVAIRTLVSHELFHGVQSAYVPGLPVWSSEGTATWAEELFEQDYDPPSEDFLGFSDEYLADAGRSLDRPPTGPVPAFAYGTALFFEFLSQRHDPTVIEDVLSASAADPEDTVAAIEAVLADRDDDLTDVWTEFVLWNVATGDRAGTAPSYEFADRLDGVVAEDEGDAIDDDNRFYPLAATYWRLDWAGGDLAFEPETDAPLLRFSLLPVADGSDDGALGPAVAEWTGATADAGVVAEGLAEGGYWLVGTYPQQADESEKLRFCLGADPSACAAIDDTDPAETDLDEPSKTCGCGTASVDLSALLAVTAALVARRRGDPRVRRDAIFR